MAWKQTISDYFSFSRRDRIGNLVLAAFILILFFIPGYISQSHDQHAHREADTTWIAAARKLESYSPAASFIPGRTEHEYDPAGKRYEEQTTDYAGEAKPELFIFDPNTLDEKGWKKLGLREKTISTILKYRSKGGRFRKPAELLNIYGLKENEFARIEPYIRIEELPRNDYSPESKDRNSYTPSFRYVDINTADTSAWIALPGIGSKLAARITSFRDKLGGFYSIEQVGETFGLQDSVFQKIKPHLQLKSSMLRKININTATIDELKSHPYIRYAIANAILSYRNEHGPFDKTEDIKKIIVVTDEIFIKIVPYLTTGTE